MSVERLIVRLRRRLTSAARVVQAFVLVGATLVPLVASGTAHGGQVSFRKITLGTSKVATSSTHAVSFRPSQVTGTGADDILGIVVDYCTSPLVGTACSQPAGVVTPADAATVNVSHNGQNNVGFTVHANSDQTGRVILTHATGITSISSSLALTFNLTVTNPSATGSFYARILTYNTTAGAAAYVPATPGTHLDDGGIAMSTANQLTINARVQEVLQFCVGTTDADTNNDCTDISGTTVDLGVVDSTAVAVTGNSAGKAMLRTNAVNGASIIYFAEQETSSGKLKVLTAACSGTSTADQCFNSAGTTAATFTANGTNEAFGMTIHSVDTTNGSTTNLTRDANYDNATEYAWDDTGTTDEIATSTTVVDDELLNLKFAAVAAATTPTGAYTVTSTFIATGTF